MEPNPTPPDVDVQASDLDGLSLVPMSLEAQWKQAYSGGNPIVTTNALREKSNPFKIASVCLLLSLPAIYWHINRTRRRSRLFVRRSIFSADLSPLISAR